MECIALFKEEFISNIKDMLGEEDYTYDSNISLVWTDIPTINMADVFSHAFQESMHILGMPDTQVYISYTVDDSVDEYSTVTSIRSVTDGSITSFNVIINQDQANFIDILTVLDVAEQMYKEKNNLGD